MDADERLTALKKAYADIILNTAKEAAARILVSERKAVRSQHELNALKDQALQMLLRLKQMMDSKVCEAEMTYLSQQRKIEELESQLQKAEDIIGEAETVSLSQQRKIEELEAQLQEAEDIVKDLREDLTELQAEIERVRNSKSQRMDDDTATHKQALHDNRLNTPQSILFPPSNSRLESFPSDMKTLGFNQRNEVHKYYDTNDYRVQNSCFGKTNLSPMPDERILNTTTPKSNLSSITFPTPKSQIESLTESDTKDSAANARNEVQNCSNPNDVRTETSFVSKPDLPSIILRGKEPQPFRNRRTQRIRAFEEKLMAGELSFSETVDDETYETSGREDGDDEEVLCNLPAQKADKNRGRKKKDSVEADNSSNLVQKVKSSRRKRRRVSRHKKSKALSSRHQSRQAMTKDLTSEMPCVGEISVHKSQACGNPSDVAPKLSANKTDEGTALGCTDVTKSKAEFRKFPSVENTMNKDKASIDKLLSTRQESEIADPICKMDVEKVELPAIDTQAKTFLTTIETLDLPVTDRVIKYTFQRKRKREALINSAGNACAEKTLLKEEETDKQHGLLVTEKSSSATVSSRDSRRLAQVARQLISLSEKKWWQ